MEHLMKELPIFTGLKRAQVVFNCLVGLNLNTRIKAKQQTLSEVLYIAEFSKLKL